MHTIDTIGPLTLEPQRTITVHRQQSGPDSQGFYLVEIVGPGRRKQGVLLLPAEAEVLAGALTTIEEGEEEPKMECRRCGGTGLIHDHECVTPELVGVNSYHTCHVCHGEKFVRKEN